MYVICHRCDVKIELSPDLSTKYSRMQSEKVVCDNCLDWYRSGGMNSGNVELPFLLTTYDKNNVKLFDRFLAENRHEEELKKARAEFFNRFNLKDEWMFLAVFNGETEEQSFSKLKQFLKENWVTEIPLPASARRLWWDYIKPDEDGNFGSFVWHPVKIDQDAYQQNGLILTICNEDYPDHMALWEGTYYSQKSED